MTADMRKLLKLIAAGAAVVIILAAPAVYAVVHFGMEAESGNLQGTVGKVADATASGGNAIRFGTSGSPSGTKCAVNLHGKGGDGAPTTSSGGITYIYPTGNGDGGGWGPHHWEYSADADFQVGRSIIANAITAAGCGQVALTGHSNGASMAVKLYCRGETFDDKLVGAIFDDPVPDQTVDDCAPASGLSARLIQSDEMNSWIGNGGFCPGGWTCQGVTYSRAVFASKLGTPPSQIVATHNPPHSEFYAPYYTPWWQ